MGFIFLILLVVLLINSRFIFPDLIKLLESFQAGNVAHITAVAGRIAGELFGSLVIVYLLYYGINKIDFTHKASNRLNSKWWYRLIKVVYFLIFMILFIIGFWLMAKAAIVVTYLDNNASYFLCDDGRKLGFNEINFPKNILLRPSPSSPLFIQQVKRTCVSANYNGLVMAAANYKLVEIYKTEDNRAEVFGYFILYLVVLLITFEIIRRVFYYIVLGAINPQKKLIK